MPIVPVKVHRERKVCVYIWSISCTKDCYSVGRSGEPAIVFYFFEVVGRRPLRHAILSCRSYTTQRVCRYIGTYSLFFFCTFFLLLSSLDELIMV